MSSAQSPRGCSIKAEERLLNFTTLRELTTVTHAFTLDVDMIDCSFCRALRLASDCSCLSLAMRLSRFLCANPAYPHPPDLPRAPTWAMPRLPHWAPAPGARSRGRPNRQVRLSQGGGGRGVIA
jgi:hypothetical protein